MPPLLLAALLLAPPHATPSIQDPKSEIHNPSPVPLGGIGCGTVTLNPNGRFTNATINNNWERPILSMPGCFAAVWTRAAEKTNAQALTSAPAYGLPGTAATALDAHFDGYFPRAVATISDARLPITVTLRAFSSLVPQDLKNSSIPAALLIFTVKNEAHAPVEASIAVSWENLLGVGGTAGKGAFSDRTGDTVEAIPATGGIFGVSMASPQRQIADPPNRLVYNARGTYALLAAPTSADTVVTTAAWNSLDARPGWWDGFARSGTVEGTSSEGLEGKRHPAGVVAMKISLKENESQELPFVIAWHTPRLYTLGGVEYGHYYEKSWDDAVEVGRYALENRQSLSALIDEWQNRLLRSSLPAPVLARAMDGASVLFTNTVLTRDSGLGGTHPGPYLFATLDADPQGKAQFGALDHRFMTQAAILDLFPALDLRELDEIMIRRDASGVLPAAVGDAENGFAPLEPPPSLFDMGSLSSYVFQVDHRYRWTGDQAFLDRFYPSVKHAVESAASLRKGTEGFPGERPEDSPEKRDRLRALWLAACAMARDLGRAMSDAPFQKASTGWIDAAEKALAGTNLNSEAALPALWMAASVEASTPALESVARGLPSGPSDAILRWIESQAGANASPLLLAKGAGWSALQMLVGAHMDIAAGRLSLAPLLPEKAKNLVAPLYTPDFWASMEYRLSLSSAHLTFRLDRMMPALPARRTTTPAANPSAPATPSLVLKQIVLPQRPGRVTTDVVASVGRAPVPGKLSRTPDGRVAFTFDTPLPLSVGQALNFQLR